ncbi:MAG: protein serine/threonine phosphatase [Bacteroidetes bacterium]|nr:protein serine/threonine phosphatase [Bacteroidota bacterium]
MKSLFSFTFLKRVPLILLAFYFSRCKDPGSQTSPDSRVKDSLYIAQLVDTFTERTHYDINLAYSTLKEMERYVDSTHYERMVPKVYIHQGQYFYNTGEYDSAVVYYNKAIKRAHEIGNVKLEAAALGNLGNLMYGKGDFLSAMDAYMKDLKLLESINSKKGIASVTGNLGVIYIELKDFKKAKELLNKSLDMRIALKDSISIAQAYGNIGTVYYEEGDLQKCLEQQFKSYNIHKAIRNKTGMGITLGNIAEMFEDLGQLDSALIYGQKSVELHESQNDQRSLAFAYTTMGNIYMAKKQKKEAMDYLLKAKTIAEKLNSISNLKSIEQKLFDIYKEQGQFDQALISYKKFIAHRDTIFNTEKISEINKKEIQFEYDKKEALTKAELEEQKLIRNGAIAGGFFILIFLIIIIRNFMNKKKANVLLAEQKHIIEEKQKEIVDSINYALQIQKTLLANHDFVNQNIPDSFVVFKPKDIVSGDFYWAAQAERSAEKEGGIRTVSSSSFYLAVCDSTGHGVPGAFMSLLNISFLNEAIKEKGLTRPGDVFEHVRKRLIERISQEGRKDGMDGILLCFDRTNNTLSYCAANNSPVLISENKLQQFQFGGDKGKKFKYKQFEELLLSIHTLSCTEQAKIIDVRFEEWKGKLEQIDDVCVIGIRL